jgi:multiple antibiotic resistance protein
VSSLTAFIVIAASALLGLQILAFFGISLASFQVGGGLLPLTGPATMSTVVIYAEKAKNFPQLITLVG